MTPTAPRPAIHSASPESALTRPVLLRAQPTTAGDSTSDKEVRDATAPGKPGQATVIERAGTSDSSERQGASRADTRMNTEARRHQRRASQN